MVDLNSRVVGRTLITTDGYKFYPDAIQVTFGDTANHVVLEKEIESWRNPETGERGTRVRSFEKFPQTSNPIDLKLASTSLVERLNGSIRNFFSHFTRQTYKFSKRLESHVHAQAIFVAYYNFVKQHRGFKGPNGILRQP